MSHQDFVQQVVWIAGGTGGLGKAASLAFLRAGANVIVSYRQPEKFEALLQEAAGSGAELAGYAVDVTDSQAVDEVLAKVLAEHGRLDALVNTVGGSPRRWCRPC